MRIFYHRKFRKKYKKLQPGERAKFKEKRNLFISDPFHPTLNNYALRGEYDLYRSIDITGDLRAHYQPIDEQTVIFITIGTHHELYGN